MACRILKVNCASSGGYGAVLVLVCSVVWTERKKQTTPGKESFQMMIIEPVLTEATFGCFTRRVIHFSYVINYL